MRSVIRALVRSGSVFYRQTTKTKRNPEADPARRVFYGRTGVPRKRREEKSPRCGRTGATAQSEADRRQKTGPVMDGHLPGAQGPRGSTEACRLGHALQRFIIPCWGRSAQFGATARIHETHRRLMFAVGLDRVCLSAHRTLLACFCRAMPTTIHKSQVAGRMTAQFLFSVLSSSLTVQFPF